MNQRLNAGGSLGTPAKRGARTKAGAQSSNIIHLSVWKGGGSGGELDSIDRDLEILARAGRITSRRARELAVMLHEVSPHASRRCSA